MYPGVAPQIYIRIKFGSWKLLNETETGTVHKSAYTIFF